MKWNSFPLQFSLRTLLFVLMPLAAVCTLAVRWTEPHFVHTGNAFDLAIEGPGYFRVTDEFAEQHRYTRGGQLIVTANGLLCFRIGGEKWYLNPQITIPSDAGDLRKTLKLEPDGRVLVLSDRYYIQQGQLDLCTFTAANLPQLARPLFADDDELGPPAVWNPGMGPAGIIRQGYQVQRGWQWDEEFVATLLTGYVLGALTIWLCGGSSVKTATASRAPSAESPSAP